MPFRLPAKVVPDAKDTPARHFVPDGARGLVRSGGILAAGLSLAACSVVGATVAVGSAAVSTAATVGSAAVSVGSTVVETTYDVTKAGVKAVAGSSEDAATAH